MPTTLGDLVTEVRYLLRSYTGQHDRTTYTTAGIDADDLTIGVDDGDVVATGMVEIDDELIWIKSASAGTLTVPPFGRGYQGSTAAAHDTNAQLIVDPVFPKQGIKQAIAETALALYPDLFQVKATEFTYSPAQSSYDLETDVDRVLDVSFQEVGPSGYWRPLKRYTLDTHANTTAFPSGNALHLHEAAGAGRTVRVLYAARFEEIADAADTLVGAGFAESMRDVLAYGACYRLVQFLEPARLSLSSVENQERSQYSAPGAASALTRQLLALYERRVEQERKRLQTKYPLRLTFGR